MTPPPAEKEQSAGNSWTPPKGPFTRDGSKLFRGDGQPLATAMAANEAYWILARLNAAAPAPSVAQSEREDIDALCAAMWGDMMFWRTHPGGQYRYNTPRDRSMRVKGRTRMRAFLASPAWRASAGSAVDARAAALIQKIHAIVDAPEYDSHEQFTLLQAIRELTKP